MVKPSKSTSSSRGKVQAYRVRSREQGRRPVQLRVPDVHSPAFRTEAARQAQVAAMALDEAEIMALIEAVGDRDEQD